MDATEILFLLLFNGLPVILLAIPIPILYKKTIGKLYLRIYLGILVFFLVYWILPIIFQLDVQPKELAQTTEGQEDILAGITFIFVHMLSIISYFLQYPFLTLSFIFVIGPVISFLLLRRKLRKEPGTMEEKLSEITYELKASPSEMIKEGLKKSGWSEEKELFKSLVVLLPISLYLLSVFIDVLGLESFSLTTGTTAIGWFIEIMFIYLATLLFGIHLLYSSRVSFKGIFVGEQLKENTFRSLYQVGTPISILSIILFLAKPTTNPIVIIYFFAYFIMGSIIFILFLKIIEPISILLLIKLIDWWKFKKKRLKEIDWNNFYYPIIFGFAATFIVILVLFLGMGGLNYLIVPTDAIRDALVEKAAITYTDTIYLEDAIKLDLYNVNGSLIYIVLCGMIMAYLFSKNLQYIKRITMTSFLFLGILVPLAVFFEITKMAPNPIPFVLEEYWITGSPAYYTLFNQNFYTIRTALFTTTSAAEGGVILLGIIAAPYMYTRYVLNIVIWGLIFYYFNKTFISKNIPKEGDLIEKIAFSQMIEFPKYEDYQTNRYRYLITKSEEIELETVEKRDDVKNLLDQLNENKFIEELKSDNVEESKRFYYTLKYLFYKDMISIWIPEFSYESQKPELKGLYIMYSDGRDVFSHNFEEEQYVDPALISGMFSAITSFIKEATKSSELLRVIDHGDIKIMLEYGKWVFAALFVKGQQTLENRSRLREFIDWFEEKHGELLLDWNGAMHPFRGDEDNVKELFKED